MLLCASIPCVNTAPVHLIYLMAEYFSHDYTSRHDAKIKRLIAKHGMAGYGIFWAIVEELYMNNNEMPCDYEVMAFDLRCEASLCQSICEGFDLFTVSHGMLSSQSVSRRIAERNDRSDKARASAERRWGKMRTDSDGNANAMRTHSDGNAIKEIKKRKKEGGAGENVSGYGPHFHPDPPKGRQPITLDHNTGVPRNEQLGLIGYFMHNAGEETLEFFRRIDKAMPTAVLCHHQAAELFDKCKRRKLTTQELKEMFRNQAITGKWEWLSDEETARVRPDMSQRVGAYIPGETHV